MKNILKDFFYEEKGQTLVEWILILVGVLLAVIVTIKAIGKATDKKGKQIEKEINS